MFYVYGYILFDLVEPGVAWDKIGILGARMGAKGMSNK